MLSESAKTISKLKSLFCFPNFKLFALSWKWKGHGEQENAQKLTLIACVNFRIFWQY